LEDISKTGKVLLARSTERMSMSLVDLNKSAVQSISRFDWSRVADVSADGDSILFDESGEGGGKGYSVHLYHVRSRTFDRLGEGRAMDLSPDGKWAITEPSNSTSSIDLIAVNGTRRLTLPGNGIKYVWVKFLPGNEEIRHRCQRTVCCRARPGPKLAVTRSESWRQTHGEDQYASNSRRRSEREEGRRPCL
jgi:hypothetical protein